MLSAAQADQPGLVVVGLDVADDEAAAVEEDHRRGRTLDLRPVDASRSWPVAARNGDVLDRLHLGEGGHVAYAHRGHLEAGAGLLDGAGGQRRRAGGGDEVQDRGDLRVERHRELLFEVGRWT
jgi:hypothetical protein